MNTTAMWGYINIGRRARDRSGRCLVVYPMTEPEAMAGKIRCRIILFLN